MFAEDRLIGEEFRTYSKIIRRKTKNTWNWQKKWLKWSIDLNQKIIRNIIQNESGRKINEISLLKVITRTCLFN